jgi:hypothetical protein
MIAVNKKYLARLQRGWLSVRALNESQANRIRSDLNQARGLIPLLMKRRNGGRWSEEERKTLLRDLRALCHLCPYLIPLLMPGGIFMLPVLAYWMDRRRGARPDTHKKNTG